MPRSKHTLWAVNWLGEEQAWVFVLTSAVENCECLQAAVAAKSITAHSKHVLSGKATANSLNETQQKFANMSLSLIPTAGKVIFLMSVSAQAKQTA